jgi:tRNA(Ile)-lysidine synthetase-like protein
VRAWRGKLPARFLIGVSGGADSVALLYALVEVGYRPHVCHLNHRWRGKASDADAQFVRALAGKLGVPATIGSRTVGHGEAVARRARLEFFERVSKKTGIRTLVLAHTADDQAETVLMRLIRGAGPTGLAGMAAERRLGTLRVVRPLLAVTRAEILEYLKARRLKWREDASNADVRFLRNRVRHVLLPLLEREFNPGIRKVLLRTAAIMRVAAGKEVSLECAGLTAPSRKRQHSRSERFDADALGPRPFVRTWKPGDRFQPLGMKGTKKLQDFFVDEKVPRAERGRVPLLCAADGRIAWVVGYRMAEPFKVTRRTRTMLRLCCAPTTKL